MRHLARGGGTIRELNDLRGPMSMVLDFFVNQQQELERYRQKYGSLAPPDSPQQIGESRRIGAIAEEEDENS